MVTKIPQWSLMGAVLTIIAVWYFVAGQYIVCAFVGLIGGICFSVALSHFIEALKRAETEIFPDDLGDVYMPEGMRGKNADQENE